MKIMQIEQFWENGQFLFTKGHDHFGWNQDIVRGHEFWNTRAHPLGDHLKLIRTDNSIFQSFFIPHPPWSFVWTSQHTHLPVNIDTVRLNELRRRRPRKSNERGKTEHRIDVLSYELLRCGIYATHGTSDGEIELGMKRHANHSSWVHCQAPFNY